MRRGEIGKGGEGCEEFYREGSNEKEKKTSKEKQRKRDLHTRKSSGGKIKGSKEVRPGRSCEGQRFIKNKKSGISFFWEREVLRRGGPYTNKREKYCAKPRKIKWGYSPLCGRIRG